MSWIMNKSAFSYYLLQLCHHYLGTWSVIWLYINDKLVDKPAAAEYGILSQKNIKEYKWYLEGAWKEM